MIYGDKILELNYQKLTKSNIEIVQEYYENEIKILESIIQYQNESIIDESNALNILNETESNLVEKVKEAKNDNKKKNSLLSKLIDNLQRKLLSKKKYLQNKIKNCNSDEEVYELVKNILPITKQKNGTYTSYEFNMKKYSEAVGEAYKKLNKAEYDKMDSQCYNIVKSFIYDNNGTLTDEERKLLEKQIKTTNYISNNTKLIPECKDYFTEEKITISLKEFSINYITSIKSIINSNNANMTANNFALTAEISGTEQEFKTLKLIKNKNDRILCQKYLNTWLANYKLLANIQNKNTKYLIDYYTKVLDKINE